MPLMPLLRPFAPRVLLTLFLAAAPGLIAAESAEFKPYTEKFTAPEVSFDMVPVPAGELLIGSPESEADRGEDEGPQTRVPVAAFWMMKTEVTWKLYRIFMSQHEAFPTMLEITPPSGADADAVSFPTPLYDSAYILAKGEDPNLPAVCMTPYAATQFARWVTAKTGHFYRLPTEAEWEYACRAGSKTAFCFGDDPAALDAYGVYFDNGLNDDLGVVAPHTVGSKKPNAFGIYDMHGNVAELVYDMHTPDYAELAKSVAAGDQPAVVWPADEYPRVLRGGSFDSDAADCRSASRAFTNEDLKEQDPQIPQSIWWFTNAQHIGFRLVRPLQAPAPDDQRRWFAPECEEIADILDLQRSGAQ